MKTLSDVLFEIGIIIFAFFVIMLFIIGFTKIITHTNPTLDSVPIYSEITKMGASPAYRDTINNICFVKVKLDDASYISAVDCDKILQKSTKPIQPSTNAKKLSH